MHRARVCGRGKAWRMGATGAWPFLILARGAILEGVGNVVGKLSGRDPCRPWRNFRSCRLRIYGQMLKRQP
jgi:hypothetical protein